MLNQCSFIGHLGADPEVRTFQDGGRVVNLRLGVTESWKDKTTGERKERTEWVSFTIFNEGLGKVAEQYLRKGSKVFLQGQMRTRKWQDQSGADRYTTEVVLPAYGGTLVLLGDPRGGEDRRAQEQPDRYENRKADKYESSGGSANGQYSFGNDLDDEIPF
jgi:single-strand DNA-binding protein